MTISKRGSGPPLPQQYPPSWGARGVKNNWGDIYLVAHGFSKYYDAKVVPFEDQIKGEMKQYSLGRPTEQYEPGQTAVFLASDESGAITGQTIVASCGNHRRG
jgi:Enoyl-(Acyl carrier protein) reductase